MCAVDGVSLTDFVNQFVAIMATGSGWPGADKPGGDLLVRVRPLEFSGGGGGGDYMT